VPRTATDWHARIAARSSRRGRRPPISNSKRGSRYVSGFCPLSPLQPPSVLPPQASCWLPLGYVHAQDEHSHKFGTPAVRCCSRVWRSFQIGTPAAQRCSLDERSFDLRTPRPCFFLLRRAVRSRRCCRPFASCRFAPLPWAFASRCSRQRRSRRWRRRRRTAVSTRPPARRSGPRKKTADNWRRGSGGGGQWAGRLRAHSVCQPF
jgi:hypothetical protein